MAETLRQKIKRHEGRRLKPYTCPTGHPTIGFGHRIAPAEAAGFAGGITAMEAEELLDSDIAAAQAALRRDLPWISQLSPARQDVLVEMVFQLGMGGLMKFKDLLFHLRSGQYARAASEMVDSLWHRQTPGRCEELAAVMAGDRNDDESAKGKL